MAIDRIERRQRVAALTDLRYAWADGAAFEKHIKQLQRDDRHVHTRDDRPVAAEQRTPLRELGKENRGR